MGSIRNVPKLKELRRSLRRSQTEAERRIWSRLRNKQFFGVKFFRQYSIGPYVLDFYSPALKLAVELDGGHHADERHSAHDKTRSDYLNTHGVAVIRFWNIDVMSNVDGVLEKIAKHQPLPASPLTKGRR